MALPLGNRLRTHLQNIVPLRSTNFQGMDVQGGYRNGHQQPAYPHQQPAAPAASSYGLDYTAANGGGPELRQGTCHLLIIYAELIRVSVCGNGPE